VEEHLPDLWPAVEAGLAACATLLLADNANPTALIYVGAAGSGKTTVAILFADHPISYRSDNFTPASFVSHAANQKSQDLAKVDLLPKIRYKVLVTPELAPMFRGKPDDLAVRFAIVTRVLDGQGLTIDSGAHGRRGYTGDYLFAWIGCTTPFPPSVWRVMAQLGSRMFFFDLGAGRETTEEDLLATDEGMSYRRGVEVCRKAVHAFLTVLLKGGVRSVNWDAKADPKAVRRWVARLAQLLATGRADIPDESGHGLQGPLATEDPKRAYAVLSNLARGRAIVHGRFQLTEDELPFVVALVLSSMPARRGRLLHALALNGGVLTVREAQDALGVGSATTARADMQDLDRLGLAEFVEEQPAQLRVRPSSEWAWIGSPEFAALVRNRGVCAQATSSASNLVEHDQEEGKEKGQPPHTPRKVTTRPPGETDPYAMFRGRPIRPVQPIPPGME
jgi:hypothetical protein